VAIAFTALAGCSTTQQNIQAGFDKNVLNYTVGKPYAEVAATRAMDDLLLQNRAYGKLFYKSQFANGDTLYRHAKPVEASSSGIDLGVFGSQSKQYNYSLFYFRVGADGKIIDFANGVLPGKEIKCLNYLGGIFQNCQDASLLTNDIAALDAAVKTSAGGPLSSWQ
jgi:hypothetical protein